MVHQKDTSQEVAGYFLLLFSGKQELGAPLGARRARVFQAVKKILLGRALLARARLPAAKNIRLAAIKREIPQ
jgi:hypothetical protein